MMAVPPGQVQPLLAAAIENEAAGLETTVLKLEEGAAKDEMLEAAEALRSLAKDAKDLEDDVSTAKHTRQFL